jgi:hypothetical protein
MNEFKLRNHGCSKEYWLVECAPGPRLSLLLLDLVLGPGLSKDLVLTYLYFMYSIFLAASILCVLTTILLLIKYPRPHELLGASYTS